MTAAPRPPPSPGSHLNLSSPALTLEAPGEKIHTWQNAHRPPRLRDTARTLYLQPWPGRQERVGVAALGQAEARRGVEGSHPHHPTGRKSSGSGELLPKCHGELDQRHARMPRAHPLRSLPSRAAPPAECVNSWTLAGTREPTTRVGRFPTPRATRCTPSHSQERPVVQLRRALRRRQGLPRHVWVPPRPAATYLKARRAVAVAFTLKQGPLSTLHHRSVTAGDASWLSSLKSGRASGSSPSRSPPSGRLGRAAEGRGGDPRPVPPPHASRRMPQLSMARVRPHLLRGLDGAGRS
ncbi:uncharacterized protein LOC130680971 [Manis pentadactyla]|uniref:uncharacterized protein LOC130680971 n=1 Tax=Manis pentadactyla TaxID=143292 RepID=UPI00255C33C5|nr:uncharacterized protein LOC130680971 [Manis pentadactyla]